MERDIFAKTAGGLKEKFAEKKWHEFLSENMTIVDSNLEAQRKVFSEKLGIPALKLGLDLLKMTEDVETVAERERQIASAIRKEIRKLPFNDGLHPSEIINEKGADCIGFSLLGGALLKEAGIKYLVGSLPTHSITLLLTSDGKVYWQDFQKPEAIEIKDENIQAVKKDGRRITTGDIHNAREALLFSATNAEEDSYLPILTHSPEIGHQLQVMNRIGTYAMDNVSSYTAEKIFIRSTILDNDFYHAHAFLSKIYEKEDHKRSLRHADYALSINPKLECAYVYKSNALQELNGGDEWIWTMEDGIANCRDKSKLFKNLITNLNRVGRRKEAHEYELLAETQKIKL